MNTYAVVLLAEDPDTNKTAKILQELDASVYDQYASRGVYFIRYSGTARQIHERVGFGNAGRPVHGIVISVSQYYGFANKELWNWMGPS
jgi:uncharacterized lipoprotein